MVHLRFGFAFIAMLLSAVAARAEFQVNSQAAGDQSEPTVAVDGDGLSIIAWMDETDGIVVRRFDAAGIPLTPEAAVDPDPSVYQSHPAVAVAGTGAFVVAWDADGIPGPDGDQRGIFAQRFDALGLPAGTAFAVNTFTTGVQAYPVVAADAAGNFAIAWISYDGQDGDSAGIFAQRFAADGTPLGGEFQVNTYTADGQGSNGLTLAMAPDGRFVVSWHSQGQDDGDTTVDGGGVYAQRYAADGTPQGGEFQVNTITQGAQGIAGVDAAMDASGNFVIVWTSNHNIEPFLPGGEIRAQRFDSAGAPVGTEIAVSQVETGKHFWPAVAADAAGNFLVTFRNDDSDRSGMFGRYFTSAGTPTSKEFRLNLERTGEQIGTGLGASGQFTSAWESRCEGFNRCTQDQDGDGAGVFAQRLASATPSCPPVPLGNCMDAGASRLTLKSGGSGKLQWSWAHGPGFDLTQYGNPVAGLGGYALCIYRADGGPASLLLEANVPAGGACGVPPVPCWRMPSQYGSAKYRDGDAAADGISRLDLTAGIAGRAQIKIKGSGPGLGLSLPVGSFTTITTQLVNGMGACWQSEHGGPARANDTRRFIVGK
jgi:hypothetical protein